MEEITKSTNPEYGLSSPDNRGHNSMDGLPSSSPIRSAMDRDIPAQDSNSAYAQTTSPTQHRPIIDTVTQSFPPFDVQSAIVQPFKDETDRDATFEEELAKMLLEVMLECNAWSAARPAHESQVSGALIEERIGTIMKTEMEQDETRKRLAEFIKRVRTALEALTGFQL